MSEYQYYEFLALDHPLNRKQMADVRKWLSRAEITPTGFTNHYEWGDFKGDPHKFLADWYDVFMYYANWGTRRLAISLPEETIPLSVAKQYTNKNCVKALVVRNKLILDWEYFADDSEDEWWVDETGPVISAAASIRQDLLRGDYRPLYLGWLLGVQLEDIDENTIEPDLPPGLDKLSGAQTAMVEFLRIDRALIETAAERSAKEMPSEELLKGFVKRLPADQKDEMLWQCLQGKSATAMAEIMAAFRQNHPLPQNEHPRRAGELRDQASAINQKEQEREEARQAAERAAYIKKITDDLSGSWQQVAKLLAERGGSKAHDTAFELMLDLQEIYEEQGKQEAFDEKIKALAAANRKRSSLIWRFRDEELLPEKK